MIILKNFIAFLTISFNFLFIYCDEDFDLNVFEKDLVKKNPHAAEILNNHDKYLMRDDRNLNNKLMGIISNSDGYEEAHANAKKFTYFSPSWFNVRRTGVGEYTITGVENYNRKWIERFMGTNDRIKITPKMTFDGWSALDYLLLATSDAELIGLSKELVDFSLTFHLHGLVLDLWNGLYGNMNDGSLILIVQEISARLRINYIESILLIPSKYSNPTNFDKKTFNHISEFVSEVIIDVDQSVDSLENYITDVIDGGIFGKKILLGLNFHGYKYSNKGKVIISKGEYLKLLEIYDDEISYDEESMENYFNLTFNKTNNVIYYPTLFSINKKINLCNKLDVGAAIFELGDVLNYFYELL